MCLALELCALTFSGLLLLYLDPEDKVSKK